jgi:hypothetical protein
MKLEELVLNISSREDLVKLIFELRNDLNINPDSWENSNLENYFEAMQSWLEDMDGWGKNCSIDISKMTVWQLIGHILLASKMYE